jgi:phosphoenolpyruvate synthase/pyruvate phosphate dikinase
MLGFRGCRLAILYPEIAEMQARAIFEASVEAAKQVSEATAFAMASMRAFTRSNSVRVKTSGTITSAMSCRLAILYPEIAEMQARAIFEASVEAAKQTGTPITSIGLNSCSSFIRRRTLSSWTPVAAATSPISLSERLAILYPEIAEMQARAIFEASVEAAKQTGTPIIAPAPHLVLLDAGGGGDLADLLVGVRQELVQRRVEMSGLPVTIRLLDPPLHEFLPHSDKEIGEVAAATGWRWYGRSLASAARRPSASSARIISRIATMRSSWKR